MTNATATDSSTSGNNGTLTNMTATSSVTIGKLGQALTFDAVNDKIDIGKPSPLNITGALTLSAWIYPRSFGGSSIGKIIDKSNQTTNGYTFFVDNSNVSNGISFGVNSSLTASSELLKVANVITLNKWQHVIVTLTSGRLATIYVNGIRVGTTTLANLPVTSSDEDFIIGARIVDNARNFDGYIDDVRTYSRALSTGEVQSLYKLGQVANNVTPTTNINGTGIASGLVGHWTFDGKNMTNATATDSSTSGNNGTLTNMTATSSVTIGKLGQAIKFNGTSQYVNIPYNSAYNSTSLSLSSWFKTSTSGPQNIIRRDDDGSNRNWLLRVNNGPLQCLVIFGGIPSFSSSASVNDGKWHFATCTLQASGANTIVTLYLDGVFQGTTTATALNPSNAQLLDIGRYSSNIEYFNGSLDDVRIYNRTLSAKEVLSLYKSGSQ